MTSPQTTARGTCSPTTDHRLYPNPRSAAKLSTTVIHALADVTGRDVSDIEAGLRGTVDLFALDRIFSLTDSANTPNHVAFTVSDYRVTVYSSGQIIITPSVRPRNPQLPGRGPSSRRNRHPLGTRDAPAVGPYSDSYNQEGLKFRSVLLIRP